MKNRENWRKGWKPLVKVILVLTAIYVGVIMILGLGFLFLLLASYYVIIDLAAYYLPFRIFVLSFFGAAVSPRWLVPAPLTPARIVRVIFHLGLATFLVYAGLSLIIHQGFCWQNYLFC